MTRYALHAGENYDSYGSGFLGFVDELPTSTRHTEEHPGQPERWVPRASTTYGWSELERYRINPVTGDPEVLFDASPPWTEEWWTLDGVHAPGYRHDLDSRYKWAEVIDTATGQRLWWRSGEWVAD